MVGSASELEKTEPLQDSMARVPGGSLKERRRRTLVGGRRDSSEVKRASGRVETDWEGRSSLSVREEGQKQRGGEG